jgi:hypothetical protein
LIVPGTGEVVGVLSLFSGYEYEFHPGSIDFLNDIISSIAVLVRKEKKINKLREKFSTLATQWNNEVVSTSSNSVIVTHPAYDQFNKAVIHPAYQKIIGMGEDIIPLLLKKLDDDSAHWFWALESITGENPVPEDERGKTNEMVKNWINWGKEKGYIVQDEVVDMKRMRKRKSWRDLAGIAPNLLNGEDAQEWVNRERDEWSQREEQILADR